MIVISGATVAQHAKMGTYAIVPDQINDGKAVFQRGGYYLYYVTNNGWAVSQTVGSDGVNMYATSTASSPELVDTSTVSKVWDDSAFQPDAGVKATCGN